jgi:hypothetical protein
MAGDKVNNYSQVDSNILALQLTTDKTFKGYHQLTLTNYDNTTVPAIAAGSAIECNGALYKFDSEEAISTTDPVTSAAVADGTVYVCIVPGATTCTAAFTATAPTWSDSKQGWYGTGGQANYRYAEFVMTKSSTAYTNKIVQPDFVKSCVYVSKSETQILTKTDPLKISFDTKTYDTKGEFDATTNYRFTAKTSGYYLIHASFFVGDGIIQFYLYIDGISTFYFLNGAPGACNNTSIVYLRAGQYLEIFGKTSTTGARMTSDSTRLNIVQVA